jgi:ATP-binding cassette subfamily B (MDR/TAP) protein 1
LRFYDNFTGEILVDGKDIRNYEIKEFRRSFGVVSQEPILFNGTISENIKYNSEGVSFEDIKDAARQANALGFIEKNDFDIVQQPDSTRENEGN